ncbi:MAG TPA: HAMP domain-containing sensor histidine kinase [Pilimelia sp.]|nr:HAMP domain-containing sensor histidine kinase [Pilimelia sp.]
MARRLLITFQSLLALVLLALAIPLALATAARDTQTVFIDRLNDTALFASLAEPALQTNQTVALRGHLVRYDELYGIAVAVVGRDRGIVAASRAGLAVDREPVASRIEAALSGEQSSLTGIVWPWSREPLVVVEPVGRAGEIIGAAVTISPTAGIRVATTRQWVLLGAAVLLAMLVGGAAGIPLTRWTLRPVHELDEASHAITLGRLDSRVRADDGPPELRRLAVSFNTMADAMCALIERQRAFVSYASHQLRNPLAALRIRVENLGNGAGGAPDAEHAATLGEVDRLTDICDGLLALARTETVREPVVDVDAGAIANERVAMWGPVAARAGITLHRTGPDRAPIRAPVGVLDQVLDALIDNAVKFACTGATVTVHIEQPPGEARTHVHVVDTGPTVDPAELAVATRPFWRGAAHQNIEGSGLGLAIVETLLRTYDGTLALTPAQPTGVRATVTLPASRAFARGSSGSPPDAAEPATY